MKKIKMKCKGRFLGAKNYPMLDFFSYPKWSDCLNESVHGAFCAEHDNFSQRIYHETDMKIEQEKDKMVFEALEKAVAEGY